VPTIDSQKGPIECQSAMSGTVSSKNRQAIRSVLAVRSSQHPVRNDP
jgi:hypothetical protein